MLEDLIKSLNPKPPGLIYDAEYHLWRDGKYLGVATWKKDEHVGDSPTNHP